MVTRKKYKDFESAVERLEEITVLLESGDATLEESIGLYTEGLEIARYCDQTLAETEKKIRIIQEKDGLVTEEERELLDGGEEGEDVECPPAL